MTAPTPMRACAGLYVAWVCPYAQRAEIDKLNPHQLSGGLRPRALIVSAIAADP